MTRLLFAIPGDLCARTGGYEYDRRILALAPKLGMETKHLALPAGFPNPAPQDIEDTLALIDSTRRSGDVLLIDGLAAGALPVSALTAIGLPCIELCHHPLCLEAGLAPHRAAELRATEICALSLARCVIVTSAHTGRMLEKDFAVQPSKIVVARPGTDRAPRAKGTARPLTFLAIGSLLPRKAFDILIMALAGLKAFDWRLDIVGSRELSPQTATEIERLCETSDLAGRVMLLGERSRAALDELLHRADVFISSSLFEGYGMALAEALARGLPIVTTTGGAAADTIPDGAALKVSPGDSAAMRDALREIITDGDLRRRLSDVSWRAGRDLPSWEDATRVIVETARAVLHA